MDKGSIYQTNNNQNKEANEPSEMLLR